MSLDKVDASHHEGDKLLPQEAFKINSEDSDALIAEVSIERLAKAERSISENVSAGMSMALKVVFFPVSILVYLIVRSLGNFAAEKGLGTDEQVKPINEAKRQTLLEMGGEVIKFGLKGEPVLEGMYFESELPSLNKKTVIVCTGSHQSYENYAIPMVNALKEMGHNVMVFNYEGFGLSEGKKSEAGVYRSVEGAYQYLKQVKGCDDDHVVAWGYSLGSGAVSELGTQHKIDIVLDRGFSSMSQVAYEAAPKGLKNIAKIIFTVAAHFNNLKKINKVKGQVFIAQGKFDTTMSEAGARLHELVGPEARVIYRDVNSAHHHYSDVWFGQEGEDRQEIKKFLER
jgi:hypothetical protein